MIHKQHRLFTRVALTALVSVVLLAGCQPSLSGAEFKALWDRYEPLPGTIKITTPPPITGNQDADARIRRLAVNRGYRLRSQHQGRLVTVAGVPIDERAAQPLRDLIAEAGRKGHYLGAAYGYRSVDLQRTLFLRRIAGYSNADIVAGRADRSINSALMLVAAPGYSKHHSGLTVDLRAAGGAAFGTSAVGEWLAANNYAAAKQFGFIPSYPPGAGAQGPVPEPWEFSYVGVKAVNCSPYLARENNREAFDECLYGSPIALRYAALGASSGPMGERTKGEHGLPDRRGRRAAYVNGDIFWTPTTGAHEVRGSLLREHARQGGVSGPLGYPTSGVDLDSEGQARLVNFEGGRIYSFVSDYRTLVVPTPFLAKFDRHRGPKGILGYPVSNVSVTADGASSYQDFNNGRIYQLGPRLLEMHGTMFRFHQANGAMSGHYGYPVTEVSRVDDGTGWTEAFVKGRFWLSAATGVHGLYGPTLDRYLANGGQSGHLGYPTRSTAPVGDGRGIWASTQGGNLYGSDTTTGHEVRGGVLDHYVATGGPTGPLGYPTTELDPPGTAGGRFQSFEHGRLQYFPNGTVQPV